MKNKVLINKIYDGKRIKPREALELFEWDILELGKAADFRRKALLDSNQVGFIIDRIINFTNVCEAACKFCAFHAKADQIEEYNLSMDEIFKKIEALIETGGSQVMLQGGLHPDYTVGNYLSLVKSVKDRFPFIYLHSFSPAEVAHMARKSGLTIDEVIVALKSAGLDSMPGASDMLVDRIRSKVSPRKITKDEWCEVIRTLAAHGMKSSATMTYGMGETNEERVEHLTVIRDIQDETNNLRAFIPWSFSPANTFMDDIIPATGMAYLKIVAISRIFLDNMTYIQAGWLTEGLKLAQIALSFGANDMGGVLTEEVVVQSTGINTRTNIDELVDIIKNAGKESVQRDSEYQIIRSYK